MRYLFSLISIIFVTCIYAQTQRGLVRTIGSSYRHGQPLYGAVIKVKGNNQQLLSGTNGIFELPMHNAEVGDTYQLLNVTKKGYELADKNFLNQTFVYSKKATLEIVMLSSEEMYKQKQAIESRIIRIVENNYKKRIDTLKHNRERGLISIKDYQTKYQTLKEQFDTYDKIISAMAEHYARTDYDRLDSLDAHINTHIINGELDQADILIAQKGNLDDRINAYLRHAATNATAKEMLDKLTNELHEQRISYEKERDDISNDLYNKHSIAISRFDFDIALEMLKLRADLDTTNIDAVWQYADLCSKQKKFEDGKKYYLICLNYYSLLHDEIKIAALQTNLGNLYFDIHDYNNCKNHLESALKIINSLNNVDEIENSHQLAIAYNSLGNMYMSLHDYGNSEKNLLLAKQNTEKLYLSNHDYYRNLLAEIFNNLGSLYLEYGHFKKSETFYNLSLEHYIKLCKIDHDLYADGLGMVYHNLGNLYYINNNYTASEKLYLLSLNIREHLAKNNPDAFLLDKARTEDGLGIIYSKFGNLEKAERFYQSALKNREILFSYNTSAYRADLAAAEDNIASYYCDIRQYEKAEYYYKRALTNRQILVNEYKEAYIIDHILTLLNIGSMYNEMGDYTNSQTHYKIALTEVESLSDNYKNIHRQHLISLYNNLADLYCDIQDYKNSEFYYKMAIKNLQLLKDNDPNAYKETMARTLDHFGTMYCEQNQLIYSEKYLKKSLSYREQLFEQNQNVFRKGLSITQYNIGLMYYNAKKYSLSEQYFNSALSHRKILYTQHPETYITELAETYYGMIFLYEDMNNLDKYDSCLFKALELHQEIYNSQPSHNKVELIVLQNRAIWRLLNSGEIDKALTLAEKNFHLDENNIDSRYSLTDCYNAKALEYAKKSDYNLAYKYINKSIEFFPNESNYYVSKGEILLMQGKNEEALSAWKKVIGLNPNFLDDYPDGTNLSNGLKKLGLIK